SYCRELVRRHQRLYVLAGPYGRGGRGSAGLRQTIAHGRVTVPAQCWKVVVIVPEDGGDDDLAKINARTRVIAVLMPNDESRVGEEWASFRTSAGEIEKKTRLNFFDRLNADVASALREKVDTTAVGPVRRNGYGG